MSEELVFQVGSDVGGTFTDVWVRASDGAARVFKSPTTPDIVGGIVAAIQLAADAWGLDVRDFCGRVQRFGHGTTVGLNALLTGSGGKTAVITTAGFADTLEIGRMKRQFSGLADTEVSDYTKRDRVPPVVPRARVAEVSERIDRTGRVLAELEDDDARRVISALVDAEVEAVAICTLWATANPDHENRLRGLLEQLRPEVAVSVSHEVAPAVGEYARMSTTAANAMLMPVTSSYGVRLRAALADLGLRVPVLMMTGAGGVLPPEFVSERPVTALLSGPAAGVVACEQAGRRMGRRNILTTDIGGTSFDVGLIVDGHPLMASEFSFAGVDMRVPCIDVRSIGAGGGSIASVQFGELTVGPQSAGADPGPACYGRGGTRPTATDADLLLGVLQPSDFASGGITLDRDAAVGAIRKHAAEPLGLTPVEAAWGIRQVLDSRMADLLRQVTIERGHDPREFTMFANGGSGPSHGWVLARELGLEEFVVPAAATVQSAFGTGASDARVTAERPVYLRLGPDGTLSEPQLELLRSALGEAELEARSAPIAGKSEADTAPAAAVVSTAAVRYLGQSHHLHAELETGAVDQDSFRACLDRFESGYEALFGHGAGFRAAGFEVLAVRCLASWPFQQPADTAVGDPLRHTGTCEVWFDDPTAPVQTEVFAVELPAPGQRVEGPCLIKYPGQTAVVPPGATAHVDQLANLIVRL